MEVGIGVVPRAIPRARGTCALVMAPSSGTVRLEIRVMLGLCQHSVLEIIKTLAL